MRIWPSWLIALIVIGGLIPVADAQAEPKRAAYWGILLMDTSLGESQSDEERRIEMISDRLVSALTESGRYVFIDTSPVEAKANLYANLSDCNGCDATLAKELGADVAVSGIVQKTSNLILHISLFIRDAETGQLVNGGSADIRGNTDESWMRGINYIIKNRILRK